MVTAISGYPLPVEAQYCVSPIQCASPNVLFIGTAINLASVPYLFAQTEAAGLQPSIVVADAGPMDLLTHMAHTGFPRQPFIARGEMNRVGGKLTHWGLSTPRPPEEMLQRWRYEIEKLHAYFDSVEEEMHVHDAIPKSDGTLQGDLLSRLRHHFPQSSLRPAPLAIDRDGHRWCPLTQVPVLVKKGVRILARFRVTQLIASQGRIVEVHGQWLDGKSYALRPKFVVLGIGVEESFPLLRQVCAHSLPLGTSDHLRIDLHGCLPPGSFGNFSIDELGVAVLLMGCYSREHHIPYHLEIKVAPRGLWARGYMPSGDNLCGDAEDASIWIQIQAISAMHDRFPTADLLNVASNLPPVLSARDASLHGEIIEVMQEVATALGLAHPTFAFRPLLMNHHTYGALRVGQAVTPEFRLQGVENLYVLPPTAYVDLDDDANPVLKSRVLARFAIDEIVAQLAVESAM